MSTPQPANKILIIDDDSEIRALLQNILEGAGYRVDMAPDGRAGLDKVMKDAPDLLILDVEMPVMNGWEVVKHIKGHNILRHLPILMLTSLSQSANKIYGLDLGADDYLTKPFDIKEVLARVRSALRRSSADLEANPLTRLPGNSCIEREIVARIQDGGPLSVLYADLNNFKAFNDRYGFPRGDKIILEIARILVMHAQPGDFVGHVGGDDFIVISTPERSEEYSRRVIKDFDAVAPTYYDPEDQARGGIDIANRHGQTTFFPFVGVALGIVTNEHRPLDSIGQIGGLGAEMKHFAKAPGKSSYAFDRRTN
ncbi:MAG: response regulator [Elusimicrobiota bacterium]|jgi:PleD family two-component response regulator